MSGNKFRAFIVKEEGDKYVRHIGERNIDDLPDKDVLIKVKYSSLNYKDALSATGNKGVTKIYPHTPGVDAAGIVESSKSKDFKKGDKVLVTGYDLGMNTPGGWGEYIRVPVAWIIKLPKELTMKEAMTIGTAGFAAGLMLHKLEYSGVMPGPGEILVTGASGGVGSMAIAILFRAGYRIAAATGKKDQDDFLKELGAKEVLDRSDVDDKSEKPLLEERWDGAVDTVGGNILATAIKSTKYGGSVATCGLTQSPMLNTPLHPFILRGVNLLGVASAETPIERKHLIWKKLSKRWKPENLEIISRECSLDELDEKIDLMLKGQTTGRIVVNMEK
jgi:acrylyl-CoA reductase (NADPH)